MSTATLSAVIAPTPAAIRSRIAACEATLRMSGANCTFVSEARSRYFQLTNGRRVRVSDHKANGNGAIETRWDAEIRVDLADWLASLHTVAEPVAACMSDMPAHVYFADHSAISQSMLKTFMDRRRLYEAYYVLGTAEQDPPTDPMRKGTATHTAILEPDRFEQLVVTYPADILGRKNGKIDPNGAVSTTEAKAFRDEHQAAGRVVLKESEAAQVRAMADSVRRVIGPWLEMPSRKEQSLYWTDDLTGLPCKMRLDYLVEPSDVAIVLDVKTTADASPAEFRRQAERLGYWCQDSHYRAGVAAVTGKRVEFYFVAVESQFPFACSLCAMDRESAANADHARGHLLRSLKRCLEDNEWQEPWETQVVSLSMRPWCFDSSIQP